MASKAEIRETMVSKTEIGYNKRRRLKSVGKATRCCYGGVTRCYCNLCDPATFCGDQFDAVLSSLYFCSVILQRLRCSRIFVKSNDYDVELILVLEAVSILGYRGGISRGGDANTFPELE